MHAGQIYIHPPQRRHSSVLISNGVVIFLSWPRLINPIAPEPICSLHMRTHKPQSIQSSFLGLNLSSEIPILAAISCNVLDDGILATSNSSTTFLVSMASFECVLTFNPSQIGCVQAVTNFDFFSSPTSTKHNRQPPYVSNPS